MSMKRALLGAAFVLGISALPAGAATFNIALDVFFTGPGAEYVGTFEADPFGGEVSAFILPAIDGISYDTVDPSWFPAYYLPSQGELEKVVLTQLINLSGAGTAALLFSGSLWSVGVYTQACVDANFCPAEVRGSYSISAVSDVPLPAAFPLLAAGLGAMGFTGWRRKRAATY
jgi:hypothetical protein